MTYFTYVAFPLHPFWLIQIHAVCFYCRFSHHMVPGPPGPHATGIPHPAIVNPQVKHEPPHETDIMHMWVLQTQRDYIKHTYNLFFKAQTTTASLTPPSAVFWDDILPGICALHYYSRPLLNKPSVRALFSFPWCEQISSEGPCSTDNRPMLHLPSGIATHLASNRYRS